MADIPSNIDKMLEEETDFQSPSSEQLFQKMGANINALIDGRGFENATEFLSNGTFTVPEFVTVMGAWGFGGGGGGSQEGGWGAIASFVTFEVIPFEVLTITVGAGGSPGNSSTFGGDGQDTVITSPTNGELARFSGARGGYSNNFGSGSYQKKKGGIPGGITAPLFGINSSDIKIFNGQNNPLRLNGLGLGGTSASSLGSAGGGGGGGPYGNGGDGVVSGTAAGGVANSGAGGGGVITTGSAGAGGSGRVILLFGD